MEIYVRAYALGVMESGMSENGEWHRRTLIGETVTDTPKLIAFDAFGEKRCSRLDEIQQGELLKINYTIEARERDGRWYNRVNLERFERYQRQTNQQ